jgi:hypothetical protein
VDREQHDAVDVPAGRVPLDPRVALPGRRHDQHQLLAGRLEFGADPVDDAGEERVVEKIRESGSGTTRANASVRCVTRLRAAWFGTYPSASTDRMTTARRCGATDSEPLTTRDTVARETPACEATISRVGRSRADPRSVTSVTLRDGHHDPLRAITSAKKRALDFGIRCWVW